MSHYKSNIRDIEFNLFEVLGRDEVLGHGPFEEVDVETARSILGEVDRLAREDLAASFEDADRHPPVYDPETHSVTMPESFKKSYQAWMDAEWFRLVLDPDLGGQPVPSTLAWSVAEMVLGSNPAVWMFSCGPSFANIVFRNGNERDKKIAQHMVDRQWGATMVLTEPDAGSDVGAGRTKAVQAEDGTWHITGVKRFITSGEHDMSENIVHLVLARPQGVEGKGGPGTKGLSLFVVPKYDFDLETGELTGERNGAFVTNVEKKMGIKVSTTCEVTFGETDPGQGLAARRGARRHRADVPGHRERPDDGRHQGHRHAHHRLPQRAGLRQGAGAGPGPHPRLGQDRAARHDHPPPRRTSLADDPEVLRRGHAGAGALHRLVAGPGAGRHPQG